MSRILGLDLGTNSVGWALVDDTNFQIIDAGVRIFQEGVNNINQTKEESKNKNRSEKRQIRRQLYRRNLRKKRLYDIMRQYNLLTDIEWNEFISIEPYSVRARAVHEKVTITEFSRALYHLAQRRGYKSNRKADAKADKKESGVVSSGINELWAEINNSGCATLGEYFSTLDTHEKRIRKRYTERSMYVNEFDTIWEKQAQFYPELLTDELREEIRDRTIFFQRPLKSQKDKIGKCMFEPNKRRAPKCSFEFQEFRMLQQVNQLTVYGEGRYSDEETCLSAEEREKIVEYLHSHDKVALTADKKDPKKSFSELKKVLGLKKDGVYRVNIESLKKIDGLKSLISLRKALGASSDRFSNDELDTILNTVYFATDNHWLIDYAQKKWNLGPAEAKALSEMAVEPDYGSVSKKAIRKILPYMREGDLYHIAAKKAGYDFSKAEEVIEKTEYVPIPERIANPIVMAGLFQMRKVVNCLIDRYGKPDIIRVEMARDLRMNKEQRIEILFDNKEREENNRKIKDKLRNEFKIANPTRDDVIKYRLWEECKGQCPYTGMKIDLNNLFGEAPKFQIEHIIPYSRSLDDSYMNKSLCYIHENQDKGNRTPFEFYQHDPGKYEAVRQRVRSLPEKKAKRFLAKSIEEFYAIDGNNGFITRQLNDTRYISRVACNLLKHICDDVSVSRGEITAVLRRYWGMNSILKEKKEDGVEIQEVPAETPETAKKKDRGDHRHHAVDAVVIALCSRSVVQKLSTCHAQDGHLARMDFGKHPENWPNFWKDVKAAVDSIIVSFKINTRVRGALHKETNYGLRHGAGGNPLTNESGMPLYALRKPVESMTANEIENIIDPQIKRIVVERIEQFGGSLGKKAKVPVGCFKDPLYIIGKKGQKTQIKSARFSKPAGSMINIKKDKNIWVETDTNHHIAIYADENGNIEGRTVSLFEASQRMKAKLPVVDKDYKPNMEFVMSLQKNEMIFTGNIPEGFNPFDKKTYKIVSNQIFRTQKYDQNLSIVFRKHTVTATANTDNRGVMRKNPNTLLLDANATKITVDPIGFISLEAKR